MKGLGIGRVVHFVMPNGEHRPAFVVRIWDLSTGYINLQVFTDGLNDADEIEPSVSGISSEDVSNGIFWATSVNYDLDHKPYTWHWPERVE